MHSENIELADLTNLQKRPKFAKQLSSAPKKSYSTTVEIINKHVHGKKRIKNHQESNRRDSKLSYYQRYSFSPFDIRNRDNGNFPFVTILIFILSIYMFCVYNSLGKILNSPWHFLGNQTKIKEFWRYISYAFVHADFSHICSNLIIFFITCGMMEIAHGTLRTLPIFGLGVIFGSLLSEFVLPDTFLVGMSGGCYALFMAHLANLFINADIMERQFLAIRIMILFPLAMLTMKDTYCGWSSYVFKRESLCESVIFPQVCPNSILNYAAHCGGAWTGFTFGIWWLRNYEPRPFEKILEKTGIIFFLVSFGLLVISAIIEQNVSKLFGRETEIFLDLNKFCEKYKDMSRF